MHATTFLYFGAIARKPLQQRKKHLAFGFLLSAALMMSIGMVIEARAGVLDSVYTVPRQSLIMDAVGSGDNLFMNVAIRLKEDGTYSLQGEGFETVLTITPPPADSVTYPTFVSNTDDTTLQPKLDGTLTIPKVLAIGRGGTLRGVILDECEVMFMPTGEFTSSGCTEQLRVPTPKGASAKISSQLELAASCNDVVITPGFYESIESSLVGKTEAEVDAIIGCPGKNLLETLGVITRTYTSVPSESSIGVFFTSSSGQSFESEYEAGL